MDRAEFDRFADEYTALHARNIALSGEAPDFFADYKMKDLAAEYRRLGAPGGATPAVLDFGAGIGTSVPFVRKYLPGARVTCLDVSARSLAIGEARFPGAATFVAFDGGDLPFADGSFDIAYAACVFHHIDHGEHPRLLGELRRVLRPGGLACVFEHNPLNPLTVKAVNECPFDENARLIRAGVLRRRLGEAGFGGLARRYRIFFPRALAALRPLERHLTWCGLGAQYYVLGVR